MADLQALQAKYQPVVDRINEFEPYGAKFVGSDLDGEQLHLVAQVPSQVVENRVWDAIKEVDPQFADLKHEITNTGGSDQTYTAVAGDNLSKISKLFYGNPNHYMKIAEASGKDDPNILHVGDQLTIPVLS
jgi:nucleoid-associated protein YgaU